MPWLPLLQAMFCPHQTGEDLLGPPPGVRLANRGTAIRSCHHALVSRSVRLPSRPDHSQGEIWPTVGCWALPHRPHGPHGAIRHLAIATNPDADSTRSRSSGPQGFSPASRNGKAAWPTASLSRLAPLPRQAAVHPPCRPVFDAEIDSRACGGSLRFEAPCPGTPRSCSSTTFSQRARPWLLPPWRSRTLAQR